MGKFVVKENKKGFTFNLKAANGEVVAVSQVYSSKDSCLAGIEAVRRAAAKAAIEDQATSKPVEQKNPKFELYKDKAGEFRFRLKASNGEIVATGEGYRAKAGCQKGIASVKKNAPDSEVVEEEK